MKIALTGGGSGGHFYPLIAVAQEIHAIAKEKKLLEADIFYIAPNPYNPALLFDNNITYRYVPGGKMRRYFSVLNIFDAIKIGIGTLKALFTLYRIFPDVLFSKGGGVSVPVVLAAKILGIPIVVHESDSVPGRANLFAAKFATKIALSYPDAIEYFDAKKTAWIGQPIRKELTHPIKDGAHEYLQLEKSIPTILILGGSLGCQKINETILACLPELVKEFQIIHQVGKHNIAEIKRTAGVILEHSQFPSRYKPFDYLNTLAMQMSAGASNLVISRGGSTIFEIAAWGVPSIIIPITDSNGDHQRKNSFNYARQGACVVIEEDNLGTDILFAQIKTILGNQKIQERMSKGALAFAKVDAAEKIAQELIEIALTHEQQ